MNKAYTFNCTSVQIESMYQKLLAANSTTVSRSVQGPLTVYSISHSGPQVKAVATFNGSTLTVQILQKSWLVPDEMILGGIESVLGNPV